MNLFYFILPAPKEGVSILTEACSIKGNNFTVNVTIKEEYFVEFEVYPIHFTRTTSPTATNNDSMIVNITTWNLESILHTQFITGKLILIISMKLTY